MTETDDALKAVAETIGSLTGLCLDLAESQAKAGTRLPGWSVQDNLSHLVAGLLLLSGRPEVHDVPAGGEHIRNALGRYNEGPVAARRERPGKAVVTELGEACEETVRVLGALSDQQLDDPMLGPMGKPVVTRTLISMIVMDQWIHEQDLRAALGAPGHTTGLAPRLAATRMLARLAGLLGERIGESAVVGITVTELGGQPQLLDLGTGAVVHDRQAADAVVRLELGVAELAALCGGRLDPLPDPGPWIAVGDESLGRRIAQNMAFTS